MTNQGRKSARAMVTFLKNRVALNQGIPLQKLTGHLSQLPPDLRTKYGSSVKALTIFLQQYPNVFVIRNNHVYLTTEQPALSGSLESVSLSTSGERSKPSAQQLEERKIESLLSVKGFVSRIINNLGFVTVTHPIQASVYFDFKVFEGGKYKNLPASGLKIGDEVVLDATMGSPGSRAKFAATHVERAKATIAASSSTCSLPASQAARAVGSPLSHLAMHSGFIENVKSQYGFIKFGRNLRDHAFFHLDKVDNPNRRKIGKLAEIVTVGDQVLFKAVPSKMPKRNTKYEALVVYVPHFSTEQLLENSGDESGNDIFMSEDDSDIEQLIRGDDTRENNCEEPEVGFPDWETSSTCGAVETFPLKVNESLVACSTNWKQLRKVSGEKGVLFPKTDEHGEIRFGSKVALASVDVTYRGKEPVVSLQFELQDNTEVNFDAVESADGKWIATLVWTEDRPPSKPSVEDSQTVFCDRIASMQQPANASPPSNEGWHLDLLLENNGTMAAGMISPISRTSKPSVAINRESRAIVTLAMECVLNCEVEEQGRLRVLEVMTFYKDGVIYPDDLNKVLKVGDVVTVGYMVATIGTREEVQCDQVWQGPRPRELPELNPEEFCKRLGIDFAALEGIPSFDDFEREMRGSESSPRAPSRVRSPEEEEPVRQGDTHWREVELARQCHVPWRRAEPARPGNASSVDSSSVDPSPRRRRSRRTPNGFTVGTSVEALSLADASDDVLQRLAKMVAAEIKVETERQTTRVVLRDTGSQTMEDYVSPVPRTHADLLSFVSSSTQT